MPHAHKKNAFSLIELAIVLVIIGLLAGGVLTGQSLIRNAELQSVISEVNQYKDAVAQFQSQYASLPGDMPDAEDYWGELASSNCEDANLLVSGTTGRETCNGNGNGSLDVSFPAAGDAQEWYHAWVQLRNADFVQGSFTGRRGATGYRAIPGENVPRSTLDDGGYTLMGFTATTATAGWWAGEYDPAIAFGRDSGNVETFAALLEPEEAWNLDTKIDDSRPGTGKVRSNRSGNCNTSTNTANQTTSEYAVASSVAACALVFSINNPGT